MIISLARLSDIRKTDLLIISTELTVLAGYDLLHTDWRLSEKGFVNTRRLICPVICDGNVSHACVGYDFTNVAMNLDVRRVGVGDFVVFLPGKILMSMRFVDARPPAVVS